MTTGQTSIIILGVAYSQSVNLSVCLTVCLSIGPSAPLLISHYNVIDAGFFFLVTTELNIHILFA